MPSCPQPPSRRNMQKGSRIKALFHSTRNTKKTPSRMRDSKHPAILRWQPQPPRLLILLQYNRFCRILVGFCTSEMLHSTSTPYLPFLGESEDFLLVETLLVLIQTKQFDSSIPKLHDYFSRMRDIYYGGCKTTGV